MNGGSCFNWLTKGVHMKNKLLITTALAAVSFVANVQAMEINSNQTYQGENGLELKNICR